MSASAALKIIDGGQRIRLRHVLEYSANNLALPSKSKTRSAIYYLRDVGINPIYLTSAEYQRLMA